MSCCIRRRKAIHPCCDRLFLLASAVPGPHVADCNSNRWIRSGRSTGRRRVERVAKIHTIRELVRFRPTTAEHRVNSKHRRMPARLDLQLKLPLQVHLARSMSAYSNRTASQWDVPAQRQTRRQAHTHDTPARSYRSLRNAPVLFAQI